MDGQAQPIGDAVADVEELDRQRPQRYLVTAGDRVDADALIQAVLPELALDQTGREPRGVDRREVELRQHIRQGAVWSS